VPARRGIAARSASFDAWTDDGDASASLAPFAGTPEGTVACMLSLAALQPGETLLDLGAGDGRVMLAALAWGARHVTGWELDADVCAVAQAALAQRDAGAAHARLVCGDCRDAGGDCAAADVVTLFLLPEGIAALTPMVRQPGRGLMCACGPAADAAACWGAALRAAGGVTAAAHGSAARRVARFSCSRVGARGPGGARGGRRRDAVPVPALSVVAGGGRTELTEPRAQIPELASTS
jgi:hypothetical protein